MCVFARLWVQRNERPEHNRHSLLEVELRYSSDLSSFCSVGASEGKNSSRISSFLSSSSGLVDILEAWKKCRQWTMHFNKLAFHKVVLLINNATNQAWKVGGLAWWSEGPVVSGVGACLRKGTNIPNTKNS